MNRRNYLIGLMALALPLILVAVGLGIGLNAQAKALIDEPDMGSVAGNLDSTAADSVGSMIPVQGKLTDNNGNPLNGTYEVVLNIYDVASGGEALCGIETNLVVSDGLFNTYIDTCTTAEVNGRQLYLGVQVGTDLEMTPRQPIYPVPYAWSLIPGARISGTVNEAAGLYVRNMDDDGYGGYFAGRFAVLANAIDFDYGIGLLALSSNGEAVRGISETGDGGLFQTDSGVGVRGDADTGIGVSGESQDGIGVSSYSRSGFGLHSWSRDSAAVYADSGYGASIAAAGTGIITSTARSTIWVSGNNVRKFKDEDSTIIDLNGTGGANISRGAVAGNKNVVFPLTVPGVLYGQDVSVFEVVIYWKAESASEMISAIRLRRQTGVGSYVALFESTADRTCDGSIYADGCPVSLSPLNNNVLTADSGILYLTLSLDLAAETDSIELGGVRLTLEHD